MSDVVSDALEKMIADALAEMAPNLRAEVERLIEHQVNLFKEAVTRKAEAELYRSILRHSGQEIPILTALVGPANGIPQFIPSGAENCMRAAIQILEAAPELSEPHKGLVTKTWRGSESLVEAVPDPYFRDRWVSALRTVLERGWDFVHIVHFGENSSKAYSIALNMLALLGNRGRYRPVLLPSLGDTHPAQHDFVIVPDKGGLELLGVTDARFYHPGKRFKELTSDVEQMRSESVPLYEEYSGTALSDFEDEVTRTEDLDGDRYLIMDGLSESIVPVEVHRERAKTLIKTGDAQLTRLAKHILDNRIKREQAFTKHLAAYQYRDFCPEQAIRRLVNDHINSPNDSLARLGAPLTKSQCGLILNELIRRLEEFENYELILLPDEDINLCRIAYLAKGGHTTLLEFEEPTAEGTSQPVALVIKEHALTRAFQENPLWSLHTSHISRGERKQKVITFLRTQVAELDA